jgi:hypothetical protein
VLEAFALAALPEADEPAPVAEDPLAEVAEVALLVEDGVPEAAIDREDCLWHVNY